MLETWLTDLASTPGAWLAQSGRTSLVIGIDPSLTFTGIAGDGWADALRPKGRGHQRLRWLREEVRDRTCVTDLTVIEGAAYGRGVRARRAGRAPRAGGRDIPYAVVNPHSRTIYATGSAIPEKEYPKAQRARIAKSMVRGAVASRCGLDCEGAGRYDQADVFIRAAMGLHWEGRPLTAVPDTYSPALAVVPWLAPAPAPAPAPAAV